MEKLAEIIGAILWIAGIVWAKGFWPTFFAVIFPPWSWFVAVMHFIDVIYPTL